MAVYWGIAAHSAFDFLLRRVGQRVLAFSFPLGDGAYSRALKAEKSYSTPFPVGGGAVVTNDWCITIIVHLIEEMMGIKVSSLLSSTQLGFLPNISSTSPFSFSNNFNQIFSAY